MPPSDPRRDSRPAADPAAMWSSEPTPFVVVLRFATPLAASGEPAAAQAQRERLAEVLDALSAAPGFRGGWVGRAVDRVEEPAGDRWLLVLHWRSVGEYRRALSSVDVRLAVVPVLSEALDEPTAFEVLHGFGTPHDPDAPWGVPGPSPSARASG